MNYKSIHAWLNRNFKKTVCQGIECCSPSKRLEWALKTEHNYEQKRDNFLVLCRSCHIKYDNFIRNEKGQFSKIGHKTIRELNYLVID